MTNQSYVYARLTVERRETGKRQDGTGAASGLGVVTGKAVSGVST
jgi:hypothetical protein